MVSLLEELCSDFLEMLSRRQLKTLCSFATKIKGWQRMESLRLTRVRFSIELFLGSWPKEETSLTGMVKVANQFMEVSLMMKTSNCPTASPIFSPWQTRGKTPTIVSSSLLLTKPHG